MIYLTMMIFIKDEKEAVFQQFEELALPILNDYKGKLIYRIRPNKENFIGKNDDHPYELHFLSFESEQDFINFSKDERRKEFLNLREDSIKSTFLVKGIKI
ncbi:DUF1330 domain-containing protein [Confluentibacter citreus]|uniref:DUF1330 domain-containing protein n=1 Tax=Confluentibacter citreus TaxID=2007307 RepID=UPI000C28AB90|nr:DUF1330 domain-containing protein [Confluentibacter citreus]